MDTTPAWTLRPGRPSDLDDLAELRAEVMREDLVRLGRYDEDRVRRRMREGFSPHHTSVVEVGGVLAGCLTVRPADQGGRCLEHFYLAPARQGRGLGSAVLRHVLAEADAAGEPVRLLVLRGSRARRLYERHGFTAEREEPVDIHLVRPAAAPGPFRPGRSDGPSRRNGAGPDGW
ncbi:GNAT family N-acetyltransferase [Kitasatospora sp. NPDC056327]|uniref:GNAT family N-acetyltransferase n=1 Tax=Kitasatospora sp. NPDC056327 TaxID=3345785 RepID=UPI0035D77617